MPIDLDCGLSVVIPVKGRVQLLRNLLASLEVARKNCLEKTEVLVVDDSEPVDAQAHAANCVDHDATYLRGPRRVGAKRNLGVRMARYDLIVFIDSDCEADADYLARVSQLLRDSPSSLGAIAGPVEMIGEKTAVLRLFDKSKEMNQPFTWPYDFSQISWAACANFAVKRAVFEQVNGFAEDTLTVVGGEDVDLGLRITKAGYQIQCDKYAIVCHSRSTGDSVGSIYRRLITYGRGGDWLCVKHPERRKSRLNPVSATVAAGLLGVLSARRTRGRGLLAAPLVFGTLLVRHVLARWEPDDGPREVVSSIVCTVLDWSFDLGELVGAFEVGRPHYAFSRFGFMDDENFVVRAATDGKG